MKHGDVAWLNVAAAVGVYEAAAALANEELLSEAVDRYRRNHPVLTTTAIIYLAAHLLRITPQRFEPLHQIATRLGPR